MRETLSQVSPDTIQIHVPELNCDIYGSSASPSPADQDPPSRPDCILQPALKGNQ